jgi:uncharacterized 2Fe-2S/4Fe-4S cluster protein (DUF4445 family)/DNA-binding GntR family transcriptional regulator
MASARDDVQQIYESIRDRITTRELAPGTPINERHLAEDLGAELASVQQALQLLAHDNLVVITPRHEHGTYVANVHLADLDQLSEIRLTLEGRSARLAARRATSEDLATLYSLREEHAAIPLTDTERLFEVDHKFHQAISQAARNKYLADMLERLYGLSQRLWYLVLPRLDFLPAAVEEHLDLLEAIRAGDGDRAEQIMHHHVKDFYNKVRDLLTVTVKVSYGEDVRSVVVEENALLGGAIVSTGLPLEQPCGGRGTCGKCKVLVEGELAPFDEAEMKLLSSAERSAGYRLACRARVLGDVLVTLAPVVVYSNKIFRASDDHLRRREVPLGLAIDLGSTTVAAFVTTLDNGKVCAGAAALNQQTIFGADVISRLSAAEQEEETAERISKLALSSIVQAVDALRLPSRIQRRIEKVTIVGNCAMHHLLLRYPVGSLSTLPFQPHSTAAVQSADGLFGGIFPAEVEVALPPLIGGFVGSDALACLAYYSFDRAPGPMAAIDLGTNGEVMVTDGDRILVASTAAGPAFEGVNISCGSRAVDGAIVGVEANPDDGRFTLTTIGDHPPVGLTGSGLLELVCQLRRAGVVDGTGRLVTDHSVFGHRVSKDEDGVTRLLITEEGMDRRGFEPGEEGIQVSLYLTQLDIRELQKAKAAVHAAAETLMARLDLQPADLERMILTGSFGSQLNMEAVVGLGMIPPVDLDIIETSANGAGFGAALFLDDQEFERGKRIAAMAEQIDLDLEPGFSQRYVNALELPGMPGRLEDPHSPARGDETFPRDGGNGKG